MKVYELQFRDGDDFDESPFVLWVKTDGHLKAPGAVVCKEMETKPDMPGIDLIISNELAEGDIITIRKALIKDIIFDLRKTLVEKGNIYSELEKFQTGTKTAIDRLCEILNKEVS